MGPRIRSYAGASIVIAIRSHGKRQCFKVGTYFFGEVNTQISSIPVSLSFSIGKLARSKVSTDFCVLEEDVHKSIQISCGLFSSFSSPFLKTQPKR